MMAMIATTSTTVMVGEMAVDEEGVEPPPSSGPCRALLLLSDNMIIRGGKANCYSFDFVVLGENVEDLQVSKGCFIPSSLISEFNHDAKRHNKQNPTHILFSHVLVPYIHYF